MLVKIGEGVSADRPIALLDLEIDWSRSLVTRAGQPIELPPLSLSLLKALCASDGETLSAYELEQALWPNQVVGADVLKQRVRLLRKALGKTPDGRDYIQTDRTKGYRLVEPLTKLTPKSPRQVRKSSSMFVAAFGFVAFVLIGLFQYFGSDDALSVRVAPFTISDELGAVSPAFAKGLSMELAARVASQPKLKAIADAGNGPDRGEDVVLVGQVARNNERIHVTVTLSQAETGQVIWGQSYDRNFEDIYEVQRDIALHISFMLHEHVDPEASERLRTGPTQDYLAYGLFVQALGLREVDVSTARTLLEQALKRDPTFAAAEQVLSELS